jgi:hypothetical protein
MQKHLVAPPTAGFGFEGPRERAVVTLPRFEGGRAAVSRIDVDHYDS